MQVANPSDMGNVVIKRFRIADIQEICLRLGNVHIWLVPSCYIVDLLILRNRVFRLRNIQICVVLSWKVFVLLIFTNSV